MPDEVVVRISDDVVPRHGREHPEPVRDEAADGCEEQVVEMANEARNFAGLSPSMALDDAGRHQSEFTGTTGVSGTSKYFASSFMAAGAAAVPPWPPFSIRAQTAIVGLSVGP